MNRFELWFRDAVQQANPTIRCECGEPTGCDEAAVDVWVSEDSDTPYALCAKCKRDCL